MFFAAPFAPEISIIYALAVPLMGMFGIMLADKHPNIREGVTLVTALVTFWLVLGVFSAVGDGARPEVLLFEIMPGLALSFKVEPLGALFSLIASGLWIINSLYSIGYMRGTNEKHQTRFYMCFAVAIFAALGIAWSSNLITFFLFYEALTLSTYLLVTHKGDANAQRGGGIYLGILMGTSIGLLLPAIVLTYVLTGTGDFTQGGILAGSIEESSWVVMALLGLYVFGIGKAALMPIHSWLPNAMVAPTPVSAFLHAVAVVKAGVFGVMKVAVYIFGTDFLSTSGANIPFMWIAGFSILLASAIAMAQDNLKARLAYSTVSQLAYVTLGAMLANSMGVMGGSMQIAMHALGKMTLFMCAGAIYVAHHKTLVSQMAGLGRKMPITFAAFFVGAMSIIGLPPMGGMWPKFFLMVGAADAGQLAIIFVLALSSILNVIYLLSIPIKAFFMAENGRDGANEDGSGTKTIEWGNLREAPFFCLLPPVLTAIGTIILFFLVGDLYKFLEPILGGAYG